MADCTFAPKLSKLSRRMGQKHDGLSHEQRVTQQLDVRERKMRAKESSRPVSFSTRSAPPSSSFQFPSTALSVPQVIGVSNMTDVDLA